MKYRAILRSSKPAERGKQTFVPTLDMATDWAAGTLCGEPEGATVEIYEIGERLVKTVGKEQA